MNVEDVIKTRKSIRKFKEKEVPNDLIEKCIDAARLAPSGHNAQPSSYIIIKDIETKKKLKKNKIFFQDLVYDSPIIIICCANSEVYPKEKYIEGFTEPNKARALRDLSVATSFLVLRATELGLGTCFIGWIKKEKIKDVLNIPKQYIVPYVIIMGYSDEEGDKRKRKDLKEIIHKEKW